MLRKLLELFSIAAICELFLVENKFVKFDNMFTR